MMSTANNREDDSPLAGNSAESDSIFSAEGDNNISAESNNDDRFNKTLIADLVAKHGSSSATAWLEFDRYKIWRPQDDIPQSTFRPVQGYMQKDSYVFAWGNPLVSDPSALEPTASAFIAWAQSRHLKPIWACVDHDLEHILCSLPFRWTTLTCIYEDIIDPAHVLELTGPGMKGKHGAFVGKDLRKNLKRAEKEDVHVVEIRNGEWSDEEKRAVEEGIKAWRHSRNGLQIAATSLEPWLDLEHRRYWLARKDEKPVGIIILTPIHSAQADWQIKNALSFPGAPKGTSEMLIHTAIQDLYAEDEANATGIAHSGPSQANHVQHLRLGRVEACA